MAGLGLTAALNGYQRGVEWRVQNEQAQRKLDTDTKARDAFSAVLDEDKAKWAMQGAEGQYAPSDDTMLRAAQAGQTARAHAGDFDGYMRGAVALAPMVTNIRQKALEMSGGDEVALAKAVYPTFMDNRELQSVDWVDGQGPAGSPAAKQLRLVLSDGSVKFMKPGQITDMVQKSVMTPGARLAEAQMLFGMKRDAARAEEDRKTVAARGEVASDLEDQKQDNRLSLADYQDGIKVGQIRAQGEEARSTKATVPGKAAGGGGGGGGASEDSLDLRRTQQVRVRLDARRKEAGTLLAQQQKAAQGLYGQERKDALNKAQATYDATMADLNKQDKDLLRRLEGGKRPGPGLAEFDRPDAAPAANGTDNSKRPSLSSFFKN